MFLDEFKGANHGDDLCIQRNDEDGDTPMRSTGQAKELDRRHIKARSIWSYPSTSIEVESDEGHTMSHVRNWLRCTDYSDLHDCLRSVFQAWPVLVVIAA